MAARPDCAVAPFAALSAGKDAPKPSGGAAATNNEITLRGSSAIVTEFFGYSINSILYQRGVYPPETFTRVPKYGLTMLVSTDDSLKQYLGHVLKQLGDWLHAGEVQRLVLVISGTESGEVLERWTFNVEAEPASSDAAAAATPHALVNLDAPRAQKSEKEITGEIQSIVRQITASVTFLPLLQESCTFDLLVYTGTGVRVPAAWEDSDPRFIKNSTEVRLRSFTTKVHKVDAAVAYRNPDAEA